jgi:hypothetical protein
MASVVYGRKSEEVAGRSTLTSLFVVNIESSADVMQGKSMETQESVLDFAFAMGNTDVLKIRNVEKRLCFR